MQESQRWPASSRHTLSSRDCASKFICYFLGTVVSQLEDQIAVAGCECDLFHHFTRRVRQQLFQVVDTRETCRVHTVEAVLVLQFELLEGSPRTSPAKAFGSQPSVRLIRTLDGRNLECL